MPHDQAASRSGLHDFDFLFGRWRVSHRRLRQRHVGEPGLGRVRRA